MASTAAADKKRDVLGPSLRAHLTDLGVALPDNSAFPSCPDTCIVGSWVECDVWGQGTAPYSLCW